MTLADMWRSRHIVESGVGLWVTSAGLSVDSPGSTSFTPIRVKLA